MNKADIQEAVAAVLKNHPLRANVQKISLFGSRLRGDARADSDVDLIIEFRNPVGFFTLIGMQDDLEQVMGRSVDLLTPHSISKYMRDDVLRSAEIVYEG